MLILTTVLFTLICTVYLAITYDTDRLNDKTLMIEKRNYLDRTTVVDSHRRLLHGHKSYLLSLYTLEQLTMSSAHFYSLVNLAYAWNLTAVEPVVCNSRIFGLQNLSNCKSKADVQTRTFEDSAHSTELDFGQLFNLTYLQHNLSRCLASTSTSTNASHNSELLFFDSLANFLEHSYRDIVLVHFVHMPGGIAGNIFVSSATLRKVDEELNAEFVHNGALAGTSSVFDCSSKASRTGLPKKVEDKLNSNLFLSSKDTLKRAVVKAFRVSNVICVDFKNLNMSLSELEEVIVSTRRKVTGKELELEASVVFTKWQIVGPLKEPKNAHIFSSCNSRWSIPYSEEVSLASKQFLSSLKVTKPFISVHMRLERLYQCEVRTQGYLDCSLQRFASLMSSLSLKYGIDPGNVVMIKDYGPYGTDSCTYKDISVCMSTTEGIVKQLKKWGYSFAEFDPKSIPGTPHSSGFVSLVEAHSLLSGEALVTLGFGSFQGSIIRKFAQSTLDVNVQSDFQEILNISNHTYRICPCTLLRGQTEQLNGLELGPSCEANTITDSF